MNGFRLKKVSGKKVKALAVQSGLSELIVRLLLNRRLDNPKAAREFFQGELSDLTSPFDLKGMTPAVKLIMEQLARKARILIWGDYDLDGIAGTVMLLEFFQSLGLEVSHYIPHRIEEGYGLSCAGIRQAKQKGIDLIITVDCGTGARQELALARELGIEVVVTDHHKVGEELPPEIPVVNPQQGSEESNEPSGRDLAGVGVAFRLLQALGGILGCQQGVLSFLDLVALGTVGDVVPLLGENRILVKAGLALLNDSRRPGIHALKKVAGLEDKKIGSQEISFMLGPRLNAAGRLEHADLAVELLTEKDPSRAIELAEKLEALNKKRQKIEEEIRKEILARVEQEPELIRDGVLVLGSEKWHPGVIGITAARLCEQYNLPVFLVSIAGEEARGSARSRGEIEIFPLLLQCAEYLESYGGHSCAGGFRIKTSVFPAFSECLKRLVGLQELIPPAPYLVDAELKLEEINAELYLQLEQFAPFGQNNPSPLFLCRGLRFFASETVGAGKHLRTWVKQGELQRKALFFGQGERRKELAADELYDVVFSLSQDAYNGEKEIFLKLQHFEPAFSSEQKAGENLIDARKVGDKLLYLARFFKPDSNLLLLVRLFSQVKELTEKLANGFPQKFDPENSAFQIRTFQELPEDFKAQQVFLLCFPPALRHFQQPVYQGFPRLHFLFGEKELEWEEKFQELIYPDQERLKLIFEALHSEFKATGFSRRLVYRLEKKLGHPLIKPITLEAGLKVFEECGVIKRKPGAGEAEEQFSLEGEKFELSTSPTFNSFSRQNLEFQELKEFWLEGNLTGEEFWCRVEKEACLTA